MTECRCTALHPINISVDAVLSSYADALFLKDRASRCQLTFPQNYDYPREASLATDLTGHDLLFFNLPVDTTKFCKSNAPDM